MTPVLIAGIKTSHRVPLDRPGANSLSLGGFSVGDRSLRKCPCAKKLRRNCVRAHPASASREAGQLLLFASNEASNRRGKGI